MTLAIPLSTQVCLYAQTKEAVLPYKVGNHQSFAEGFRLEEGVAGDRAEFNHGFVNLYAFLVPEGPNFAAQLLEFTRCSIKGHNLIKSSRRKL